MADDRSGDTGFGAWCSGFGLSPAPIPVLTGGFVGIFAGSGLVPGGAFDTGGDVVEVVAVGSTAGGETGAASAVVVDAIVELSTTASVETAASALVSVSVA